MCHLNLSLRWDLIIFVALIPSLPLSVLSILRILSAIPVIYGALRYSIVGTPYVTDIKKNT